MLADRAVRVLSVHMSVPAMPDMFPKTLLYIVPAVDQHYWHLLETR